MRRAVLAFALAWLTIGTPAWADDDDGPDDPDNPPGALNFMDLSDHVHEIAAWGRLVSGAPLCGLRGERWSAALRQVLRDALGARTGEVAHSRPPEDAEKSAALRLLSFYEEAGRDGYRRSEKDFCSTIGRPWLIAEADDIVTARKRLWGP